MNFLGKINNTSLESLPTDQKGALKSQIKSVITETLAKMGSHSYARGLKALFDPLINKVLM